MEHKINIPEEELRQQSAILYDKHTEFLEEQKANRRDHIAHLCSGKKIIYHPIDVARLNATIKKIAKQNKIEDKIPKQKFNSLESFVQAIVDCLGVQSISQDEISQVITIFEEMQNNKVN